MAQVELRNVSKHFGSFVAVDRIDLNVADREFVVLVGPSGCGKTTTLRLIAGLEDLSGGEIAIGGQSVNRVAPKDRNIAMVFQNYALYPHMTVYDNMAFGLRMRRVAKSETDRRVREAAAILDITELLPRKPAQLSGGQRQRVALGRAMVRDPAVFLFDEPLSNLDARLRVTMRTELVKLHERLSATMVYVTHDQIEAMMMGDRIVLMNQGTIQQIGPPREVYERPVNRFVAEFIGSPPMNLLPAKLTAEAGSLWVDLDSCRLRLPYAPCDAHAPFLGRAVTFGIRPEDIQCHIPATATASSDWQAIHTEVVVAQPIGAETLVTSKWGGAEITARVANGTFTRHQACAMYCNLTRVHLFAADTDKAIQLEKSSVKA